MAKGHQRSNREAKKPKKEKIKVIAAAASVGDLRSPAEGGVRVRSEVSRCQHRAAAQKILRDDVCQVSDLRPPVRPAAREAFRRSRGATASAKRRGSRG